MPSYRGLTTVVFTTDLAEQEPFSNDEPACSLILLHILATAWCRANMTDGVIPAATIKRLASWSTDGPRPVDQAKKLVETGRWVDRGDGCYELADYCRMQLTVAERDNVSEVNRENRLGTKRRETKERPVDDPSTIREPQISSDPVSSVQYQAPSEPERPSDGSLVPRVPEPKPKKASRKPTTHHNREAVIDIIDRVYFEATGQKPNWKDGKNLGIANSIATGWPDLAEIEARARRFWIERLPGFAWNGKLTVLSVADFRAHFERLAIAKPHANGVHRDDDFVPFKFDYMGNPV